MNKSILSFAIASSLSLIAGCGGGGGGSDDVVVTPTPVVASSLSGTAAAGIITQGIVTAVELNSDGTALAGNVGTAITDSSGHYNLTLNDSYAGGIVRVTLTADSNTKMKCDAFGEDSCGAGQGFGSLVDLPAGFSLNAIVNPVGEVVSVQITPLTHMAAARALSTGTVTAESVAAAISEVSSFAGVNIMSIEVPDITDPASLQDVSEDAKYLALVNSGLASVLFAGDLEANFNDRLGALASSFEDGAFDSDDGIKITDITQAMEAATIAAGASASLHRVMEETVHVMTQQVAVIESQIVDGSYNPEPTDSVLQSKVDQAKSLITDARTFIEKIGSDFESPVDALSIDAETAEAVLSEDTAIMVALLGEVVAQVLEDLQAKTTLTQELESPGSYSTTLVNGATGETINGSIVTTFSTNGGIAITLNGALTGSEQNGEVRTVEITDLKLATDIVPADLTVNADVIENFAANDVQLLLSGFIGNADTSLELESVAMSISTTGVNINLTDVVPEDQGEILERAVTGASFDGEIIIRANNAIFNGDVVVLLVDLDEGAVTISPLSVKSIAIDGEFTSERGAFVAGAQLTIDNAASFNTYGLFMHEDFVVTSFDFDFIPSAEDQIVAMSAYESIALEDGNTVDNIDYAYLYYSGYMHCADSIVELGCTTNVDVTAYASGNGINGEVDVSELSGGFESRLVEEIQSETGVEPVWVYSLYGFLDMSGAAYGLVYAELPEFETSDNFVQGSLMLSTSITVPNLPEATVVVSANRVQFSGGDASIVVSHDGQSFTLNVVSIDVEADEPEAVLTLSNSDDVELVMNLQETEEGGTHVLGGNVMVGDTQVGIVSETDSGVVLIRYSDGSFESLY